MYQFVMHNINTIIYLFNFYNHPSQPNEHNSVYYELYSLIKIRLDHGYMFQSVYRNPEQAGIQKRRGRSELTSPIKEH